MPMETMATVVLRQRVLRMVDPLRRHALRTEDPRRRRVLRMVDPLRRHALRTVVRPHHVSREAHPLQIICHREEVVRGVAVAILEEVAEEAVDQGAAVEEEDNQQDFLL